MRELIWARGRMRVEVVSSKARREVFDLLLLWLLRTSTTTTTTTMTIRITVSAVSLPYRVGGGGWRDGRRTNDEQTPPLLPPRRLGTLDTRLQLLVPLLHIVNDLLTLGLDIHHGRLLLHHQDIHILEQLRQLDHLALDLLDGLVPALHGIQGGSGLSLSVALQQGLAEDLLLRRVLDRLLHLLLRGVGPHDAVLSRHLRLQLAAEVGLDVLVLVDGRLELAIRLANLRRVARTPRLGLRLDGLDAAGEVAVHGHGVRTQGVELPVRGRLGAAVGVVEGALLEHAEAREVLLDGLDALVDGAAFVEDGIGVLGSAAKGAAVLGQGRHLDILTCWHVQSLWATGKERVHGHERRVRVEAGREGREPL